MASKLIVLIPAILSLAHIAAAAEYPCPSDPGFCYRDIGNDGCFDVGPDTGPINAEIESQSTFPAIPPAGTIVCPPSVASLTAGDNSIRLATASGSSILFYGTTIQLGASLAAFDTMSGDAVVVEGKVFGAVVMRLLAEGDIEFDGLFKQTRSTGFSTLESASGNVLIRSRSNFKTHNANFRALAGDITFEEKVAVKGVAGVDSGVFVEAAGDVEMTNTKIKVDAAGIGQGRVIISGANVSLLEKTNIKAKGEFAPSTVKITATTGDVLIERLSLNTTTPIEISGTNVAIGVEQNGKVRPSKITEKTAGVAFDISATDSIDVERLVVKSKADISIETTGTTLNLLRSILKGAGTSPTITVSGGVGSTCDLTGTQAANATLVTSCDTVVGP